METYSIESESIKLSFVRLGGRITSLACADRHGKFDNVVLSPVDVSKGNPFYGAIIGRVANRIQRGHFTLHKRSYNLQINNPPNHLHGGPGGFHAQMWDVKNIESNKAILTYTSPGGEENYPGKVTTEVSYTLIGKDLIIDLMAYTDQATPINLTHHCFFNLAGEGNGHILNHVAEIYADQFTPLDQFQIPTGEIKAVAGTPFDFTRGKTIGKDIDLNEEQLNYGQGYDHNFVLRGTGTDLKKAARVEEPLSGRILEAFTDAPCMQFYTGNFMDGGETGASGKPYDRRTAFCLEPQHFPDAVNQPSFPSVILEPGKVYDQQIIYRFGIS